MELSVNADDPLLDLVFSSTLRRWVEVKQTLVSSFRTSKSEVEGSKLFHYFILPLGLASLLLSSAQHSQWFRLFPPSSLKLIWGALKCKPDEKTKGLGKSDGSNNNNKRTLCNLLREINEGEPPWPRWIMIPDHGDERLQWIRQKVRTGRGIRDGLPPESNRTLPKGFHPSYAQTSKTPA